MFGRAMNLVGGGAEMGLWRKHFRHSAWDIRYDNIFPMVISLISNVNMRTILILLSLPKKNNILMRMS